MAPVLCIDSGDEHEDDPNVTLEELKKAAAANSGVKSEATAAANGVKSEANSGVKAEGTAVDKSVKREGVKREVNKVFGGDIDEMDETGGMAIVPVDKPLKEERMLKVENLEVDDDEIQVMSISRAIRKKSPSRSQSRSRSRSSKSSSDSRSDVSRSRSGSLTRKRVTTYAADVRPRSKSRKRGKKGTKRKKRDSKFTSVSSNILCPRKRAVRRSFRTVGAAAAVALVHSHDPEGDTACSILQSAGPIGSICQI